MNVIKKWMPFLCGILFGIGLAMSGMTDTNKVLGFLDVFGDWIPDLIFVMGGAVFVTLIGFHQVLKRTKPVWASQFYLPQRSGIDKTLLFGASVFGIGWGIYGYCPGPAIASLLFFQGSTWLFLFSMIFGMYVVYRFQQ